MHASGQTNAQAAQPTHESGTTMVEKLYPLEFASMESSNTFDGQATTHKLHPLQRSIFTTTAPFIFAIIFLI